MRRTPLVVTLLACGLALSVRPAPAPAQLLGTPVVGASQPGATAATARGEAGSGTLYRGLSGALRAVVLDRQAELSDGALRAAGVAEGSIVRWVPLHGTAAEPLLGAPLAAPGMRAPAAHGIWLLAPERRPDDGASDAGDFAVVTRVPFDEKRGGRLNGYHIGRYPTEGTGRSDRYAPPVGFIEVTRENQDFHISENFRLRQFLTKDQHDVWPKYLVLDLRLLDKLELVLQELNAMGVRADRMHVMSGFRTPQYNGPGTGGRAQLSRHTYGDAADVWVDNDGNGYMDDLNGDGVVDLRDAEVMLRAVERVERRHPELVGGAGLYVASPAHGPYIHIDVRGTPARW
jgi:uncharacterized protein YcbK (DUF882 family)